MTIKTMNYLLLIAICSSFITSNMILTTTAFTISSENSKKQNSRQLISRFGIKPSNMICEDGVCRRVDDTETTADTSTKHRYSKNSKSPFPVIYFDDFDDTPPPPLFAEEAATIIEEKGAKEEANSSSTRSSSIIDNLNDSNFEKILYGKGNNGDDDGTSVLVDCYATWCGPCKKLEPALESCAKERGSTLKVVKYDIQSKNVNLKLDLLTQGVVIERLPLLVLFQNGKPVAEITGAISDDKLEQFLDSNNVESKNEYKQIHTHAHNASYAFF